MRRRRVNKNLPANLYTTKVGGKYYFSYRNPKTGKRTGMGTDKIKAVAAANQLNQKLMHQVDTGALVARVLGVDLTMGAWLDEYMDLFMERAADENLSKDMVTGRQSNVRRIRARFGDTLLADIDVEAIARFLKSIAKDEGKARTAQNVRSTLIDIYTVAREEGRVTDNPAAVTRNPRNKVTRARLKLAEYKKVLEETESRAPWHANAMLLGLLTGQRRGDICRMKFRDIEGGWLHIRQNKTGACVRLSLDLGLDAVGMTIGDAVARCRDRVVSPYLLHHTRRNPVAKPGDPINRASVSRAFLEARKRTGLNWGEKSPPSFHEIRSLSGRLYKDSIDPQALWGHTDPNTTRMYLDSKGTEWISVSKNPG
jgi:integrase